MQETNAEIFDKKGIWGGRFSFPIQSLYITAIKKHIVEFWRETGCFPNTICISPEEAFLMIAYVQSELGVNKNIEDPESFYFGHFVVNGQRGRFRIKIEHFVSPELIKLSYEKLFVISKNGLTL